MRVDEHGRKITNIDGQEVVIIDGVEVSMTMPVEQAKKHIDASAERNIVEIHDIPDWRAMMPIAIVGGGPSLIETLPELRKFKLKMACGSVYDFLVKNGVIPNYCVVCDPDPIMARYITLAHPDTLFLVASMCAPEVYDVIEASGAKMARWHVGGSFEDNNKTYGEKTIALGGGCTVATRAMVIADCLGFQNQHLFGLDSCITPDRHHAYEFVDPEAEKFKKVLDIYVGTDKFTVADYMMGQIFDFQMVLKTIGNKVQFTVHGEGALKSIMNQARLIMESDKNG